MARNTKIAVTITIPKQEKFDKDKLFKVAYDIAHKAIQKMSAEEKLEIAGKIESEELPDLYDSVKLYSSGEGYSKDEVMSAENFVKVMNKIKHWEQLLEWLYEYQFDIPLDLELEV